MAKLKELDIKPALTLASNSATKPLVLAGVNKTSNFPKLLSEYKWTSAKPYDMALIIIAYYAYCMKSDEQLLKDFGKTAKVKTNYSFKLLNCLLEGNGTKVKALIIKQPYFQNPMNKILEAVIPGTDKQNILERSQIIANFVKQAGKITPGDFDEDKKDMLTYLIGIITDNKKEELKEELKQVKAHFTPEKKEAAKNAANATNIVRIKKQLKEAVESDSLETVRQIIESNPTLVNSQPDNDYRTFLCIAAEKSHTRIVEFLLQHGADPNYVVESRNPAPPLHEAAINNNRDIVNLLLDHGADLNALDSFDAAPLHHAVAENHPDIVNLLLDRGADPNIQDSSEWTPLHHAVAANNPDIVNLLLDHGADPDLQSDNGKTALHFAAGKNNRAIIDLLLRRGANPEILNNRGETYLDLLPNPPRRIQVEDFPQNEFRNSFAENETRQCPVCLEEYGANDLCCIFNCQHSEEYPFGHYLCNDCAQSLLDEHGRHICPQCRKGLKRRR